VSAIDCVSQLDGPDAVVVRGFVQDQAVLNNLNTPNVMTRDIAPKLYEAAPTLHDADKFVVKRWRHIGYAGMHINGGVSLDQLRTVGILPHVDEPVFESNLLEAIVQGSLCLSGDREFMAERLPQTFYNDTQKLFGKSRQFDLESFNEFLEFDNPFMHSVLEEDRKPRSSVVLQPGDLALFAHHPAVTLHSAQHLTDVASARLLMWQAKKTDH
jgi:hypothetical protein